MARWCHVREPRKEESIARRSRRPRRGIGGGGRKLCGEHLGVTCENTRKGESIARRSRRPRRGIGGGGRKLCREHRGVTCENYAPRGKHRTEVTEATEGDLGRWAKAAVGEHRGVCVRELRARGKHRTEVTEATEGDRGWWAKASAVNTVASGARTTRKGKASHGGHGGHGEGLGLGAKALSVNTGGVRCENYAQGESIARRSRRPRRGIWGGGESYCR